MDKITSMRFLNTHDTEKTNVARQEDLLSLYELSTFPPIQPRPYWYSASRRLP